MNNAMGVLLVLLIFFGIMFISYWLMQITKVLNEIKDKL
jgi:hypothetical protein